MLEFFGWKSQLRVKCPLLCSIVWWVCESGIAAIDWTLGNDGFWCCQFSLLWNFHGMYITIYLCAWLYDCWVVIVLDYYLLKPKLKYRFGRQLLLEAEPRPQDNWGHTADKSNNYAPINDNRPPLFPSIFTAVKADPSMSCKVKTRKSIYLAATTKYLGSQKSTCHFRPRSSMLVIKIVKKILKLTHSREIIDNFRQLFL